MPAPRHADVTVEQPLSNMSGFSLRTVWLNDPDGVTNYFAPRWARGPHPLPGADAFLNSEL